jgi:glycoside/pentoside/hexuronide:cation symporter, GPH family
MLTIIPGVFHYLVGALMQRYRITDEAYRTLLAGLLVTQQAESYAAQKQVSASSSSVKMTVVPGVSS